MAVNYEPDSWDFVSDLESLEKEQARNRKERRDALDWCLENSWASKDVGCVERIDTATRHGWQMAVYRE
jgi:hypothetical protein